MKITIETDGSPDGTRAWLNGREQLDVQELDFQVSRRRGKQASLYFLLGRAGEHGQVGSFTRYFGNDFKRYDELFPRQEDRRDGQ